jgi:uncharacterized protein
VLGFLIDSNCWLAAAFDHHACHQAALAAIEAITVEHPAYFCRAIEQSILRLLSTAAIQTLYETPLITNEGAIRLLTDWQSQPNISFMEEPANTRQLWLRLADRNTASPKLWMDAYLAAFAISGNLRFVSNDQAFRQFEAAGLDLQLI